MYSSRWSRLLLAVAFALVAGACSGNSADPTTTPSEEPSTSAAPTADSAATSTSAAVETAAPPTTEAPASTTTTAAPTTTVATTTTTTSATPEPFVFGGDGFFPPALGGPTAAHGSGCAPGPGSLPDGIWFGFPTAWTNSSIEFDLACFYTGDAAAAVATAEGEESPPPNDYIISNQNPALRTVPVAADAVGHRLTMDIGTVAVPFADFRTDPGEFQVCFDFCLMWLYVNDGEVTEIVSQFVP